MASQIGAPDPDAAAEAGTPISGGGGADDAAGAQPAVRAALASPTAAEELALHSDYVAKSLLRAIELVSKLTLELNVHDAMRNVRQVALDLLQCERVTLFLILRCKQELRGRTGTVDDTLITVKFGEGIAGHVAQHGGLMNIRDAYSHPLFNPAIDARTGFRTRNILCCAVNDVNNEPIAVLQALNKRGGADFSAVDEQHLRLFSVHLGNTLAKIRFYEEAKREKERMAALSKCFKMLGKASSLEGALSTITDAVRELVRAERVVVFLLDHAREVLWTSFAHRGRARQIRTRSRDGCIGRCATSKQQLGLDFLSDADACGDPTLQQLVAAVEGGRLTCALLQPVLDPSTDGTMAVLVALNKEEGDVADGAFDEASFSRSDRDALGVLSMEVADALSARALEVSFASAMSVVAANGANTHNLHLAHMMRAQLLDYYGGDHTVAPDPASRCSSMISGSSAAAAVAAARRSEPGGHGGSAGGSASGSASGGAAFGGMDASAFALLARSESFASACSSRTAGSGAAGSGSGFAAPFVGLSLSTPTRPLSPGSRSASPLSPRRLPRQLSLPISLRRPRGLPPAAARPGLLTFELDCLTMSRDELIRMAYDVFTLSGVVEEVGVSEGALSGFLSAVASHYHEPGDVPYHNLSHAVQVLHMVWLILELSGAHALLSPLEELVLLVAAICHDLDHDGRSNSYHINAHTELAQRYNDRSVQENHHCALTFAVLRSRGANLLEGLPQEDWRAARRLLVDAILATDMSHHFGLTQELQKHPPAFAADNEADRALLTKAILHAADIANPVRPFRTALVMAHRVHEEFALQAAAERRAGLPVTPHMEASSLADRARMEIQFLDYVAGPLWERLAQAFPALQPCIAQMRFNRRCFQAIASGAATGIPLPPFEPGGGAAAAEEEREAISAIAAAAEAAAAARPPPRTSPAGRVLDSTPEESSLPGTDGEEDGGSGAPPSPLQDSDPIAGLVVRTRRAGNGSGGGGSGGNATRLGSGGFGGGGGASSSPGRPASYSGAVNLALAQVRAAALRSPRSSSDGGDGGTPTRARPRDGVGSPLGGTRGGDGRGGDGRGGDGRGGAPTAAEDGAGPATAHAAGRASPGLDH
ncbi:cAMP phosphodiesterase [Raphidocelis subcapitata]|uniref:Phosphodiesterase n=1 Tax=Raphidocelis subcapitata TaxID=307507 RepID=A0A2V0PKP0_9CHLO|nr:cAMP phosphodiesterase [Raphidocelis subcapitata]|eukprot:GBG00359.1 cAMP phosphodiesterase [Raphidocelis subcapitata]